jgi:hypothetical protein
VHVLAKAIQLVGAAAEHLVELVARDPDEIMMRHLGAVEVSRFALLVRPDPGQRCLRRRGIR